ncbi:hypothetical protein V0288_00430 [Pannus brasiliensis CCIBt3594]|uniref:Uncharacterized protein n=1 Tax=Pannus brasiliensis CCIBt3594 TaxID=1427578 RepID=A0AAW9QCT8_9CHRO
MNASEQAKGLELTAKIATIVNLFKREFPDARADLKPWHNDPNTREFLDPDSIDIAFHFPGWSRRIQSRSILVQIRFFNDAEEKHRRLIGLEMQAINFQGLAWRLSTIENWQFVGNYLPAPDAADKLKSFSRQIFDVFKHEDRS